VLHCVGTHRLFCADWRLHMVVVPAVRHLMQLDVAGLFMFRVFVLSPWRNIVESADSPSSGGTFLPDYMASHPEDNLLLFLLLSIMNPRLVFYCQSPVAVVRSPWHLKSYGILQPHAQPIQGGPGYPLSSGSSWTLTSPAWEAYQWRRYRREVPPLRQSSDTFAAGGGSHLRYYSNRY
jgi:hypothetical protein